MKFKTLKFFALLILGALFFASCEYENIMPEEVILPEVVSFMDDVIPVFNNKCNMTGCHSAGHFVVDLTPENAYTDLFAKNMIDTDNPSGSDLYTKIAEAGGTHDGRSTPSENQLILKWIEEGALNN